MFQTGSGFAVGEASEAILIQLMSQSLASSPAMSQPRTPHRSSAATRALSERRRTLSLLSLNAFGVVGVVDDVVVDDDGEDIEVTTVPTGEPKPRGAPPYQTMS